MNYQIIKSNIIFRDKLNELFDQKILKNNLLIFYIFPELCKKKCPEYFICRDVKNVFERNIINFNDIFGHIYKIKPTLQQIKNVYDLI